METKQDKILEKLRKLMNLKESAEALGNEGEANAAAAGITRLLMAYNLSEDDIPEQEKIENPIVVEEIPYKSEVSGGWYSQLITVICNYNMCRSIIIDTLNNGRRKRSKFQLIGRKNNVEVVMYLISFLSHQFVSIGKKNYSKYKCDCIHKHGKKALSLPVYLKSFLHGCVVGLFVKFEEGKKELEKEMDITAIIVTTKGEIDDFLKDIKTEKVKKSKAEIDSHSAMQGFEIGKNTEINKGIHAETVSKDLRLH